MPLVNRDKDIPEQRDLVTFSVEPAATGATFTVLVAPYAAEVSVAQISAIGLSGSPTAQLSIGRFVVGSGATNLGTGGFSVVTLQAFGTSGIQTVAQNASGNSLIQLAKGDILQLVTGGANSAANQIQLTLALKCLQDIKSHFGI